MSHYSKLKTKIKRKTALIKALKRINNNKWASAIEVHDEATNLYGYTGDKRADKAEIIIRRKDVGQASNDIGFKQAADGSWEAIISDYDSSNYNKKWLDKLNQLYADETIKEVGFENGYTVESQEIDGEMFVTCTRGY